MSFPIVHYIDIHTGAHARLDSEDIVCPLSEAEIASMPRPDEHMCWRKNLPTPPMQAGEWFDLGYTFDVGETYAIADARGVFWRSLICEESIPT